MHSAQTKKNEEKKQHCAICICPYQRQFVFVHRCLSSRIYSLILIEILFGKCTDTLYMCTRLFIFLPLVFVFFCESNATNVNNKTGIRINSFSDIGNEIKHRKCERSIHNIGIAINILQRCWKPFVYKMHRIRPIIGISNSPIY